MFYEQMIKNDYKKAPLSGGAPKQIVVLLHGYGSNGQDLISLAPYFQAGGPDAIFISPDAPFPCGMANMTMGGGFEWFPLEERTPEKYLEGAQMAHPVLDAYLDQLLEEYGVSEDKMLLVGFSQGTMMSLYSGLRRRTPLSGVLGYSGALIGEDSLPETDKKPPICLIHGEIDSVVPVAAYHHAKANLTEKGYDVSGHTSEYLEHSIDEQGIEAGAKFISKNLNKNNDL